MSSNGGGGMDDGMGSFQFTNMGGGGGGQGMGGMPNMGGFDIFSQLFGGGAGGG